MPRARRLETYPNERFYALIKRVIELDAPFLVPCTQPQAASIRGEIYAWRRAAEDSRAQALHYGIDLDLIRKVVFRIGPDGLTALPERMVASAAILDAALTGGAPVKSEAALALERMQTLLKEHGNG